MKIPFGIAMIGSRGVPGHRGGVERVLEAVCPRLVRRGHPVRVYCASWSEFRQRVWQGVERVMIRGIRHQYFDTLSRSFLASCRAALASQQIAHYHAIGSAPLALIPRLAGKKVVTTVHGLDWRRRKWNWWGEHFLRFGEWASCRLAHRTIAVSMELKRYLEARYRIPVFYIPNGVEQRNPRPLRHARQSGLDRHNFILYLARLVPEKRCDLLVDAFLQLALADRRGMKLVIAGATWHSQSYADGLRQKCAAHPEIVWLGEVEESVLEELYSNCFAYVLPSEVEGMSLSLLDAMAFGACIVTSSIPANADVVGEAGVVFRSGDASDLAQKLQKLISDPESAQSYREAIRRRVGEEYDWDRIADRWLDVYRSLGGKS